MANKNVVQKKKTKRKVQKYVPRMEGPVKNLTLKVKYELEKTKGLSPNSKEQQINVKDYVNLVEYTNTLISTKKKDYKFKNEKLDIDYIRKHFSDHLARKVIIPGQSDGTTASQPKLEQ